MAANLARNARRGSARRDERESRAAKAEAVAGGEVSLERIEIQRALFEHVLALPEEQRTVLYLRYYEELSPLAIAERLKTPLKTVKSRQTRGLAALRERLDARSKGDRRRWMEALSPLTFPSATSVTPGPLIGGLLVKKFVVAAVIVLVSALALWILGRDSVDRSIANANQPAVDVALAADRTNTLELEASMPAPSGRSVLVHTSAATKGALDVRLTWSDGTPAADVGLTLRCAADLTPRVEFEHAVTDADGLAHFEDLDVGKVSLRPDFRSRFDATVEAGATRTIVHTIPVGVDVTGRVVGPDATPVSTASLWWNANDQRTPDVRYASACEQDGTFRLRDVAKSAFFGARARGFRPSPCVTAEALTIGANGVRTVELQLESSGGRIRGRVLDPDGAPLAHARVLAGARGGWSVRLPSQIAVPNPAIIETSADGTFELIDDFEPGRRPVRAIARGFPMWTGEVDVVGDSTTSIEIRLEHPARLEGRVLDFDGQPIADVDVIAATEESGGRYSHAFPPSQRKSDANGRFALDWIAPGPCELNAHDYVRPEIGRAHVTVTCTAGTTTRCDLRLERGLVIAGRVQDTEGAPLANWSVGTSTVMNDTYPRRARTAEDGSFSILNVGDGVFEIVVRAPEGGAPRASVLNVRAGTSDVLVVVANAHATAAILRGRIVDPNARSLGDVQFMLWRIGTNEGHYVSFDAITGRFEKETTPGRYRLTLRRGNRTVLATDPVVLEEGSTLELGDLVFSEPGRVEISLTTTSSDLLASLGLTPGELTLALDRGPGMVDSERLSLVDGVWRSEIVLPGMWSITLSGDAKEPQRRREVSTLVRRRIRMRGAEIEVRPGELARFDAALEPAFELRLSIRGANQDDIVIETRDAADRLIERTSNGFTDGSRKTGEPAPESFPYHVVLPSGRARIRVSSGEDRVGEVEVDVGPDSPAAEPTEIVLSAPR